MGECSDLQALGNITSEADESQLKIILSIQCIKEKFSEADPKPEFPLCPTCGAAWWGSGIIRFILPSTQLFLVDRLRKESGRQKEVCKYISSGNLKLQAEITHADQEFKSILAANDTIKTNNVEIRKDLLLAKERKLETIERVETGIKKYENLWLQCKSRYESIPFVKIWFEVTSKSQSLKDRIKFLDQELEVLTQEVKSKRIVVKELEKTRIIDIAKYFLRERPIIVKEIKIKLAQLNKLSNETAEYFKKQNRTVVEIKKLKEVKTVNDLLLIDSDWPSLSENLSRQEDTLKMPQLTLGKNDLDLLAVNLEQIKKTSTTPVKKETSSSMQIENTSKSVKNNENAYISTLFNQSYLTTTETAQTVKETEPKKFARKRLINILEDISIDKKDASDILSNANPNMMQVVDIIGGAKTSVDEEIVSVKKDQNADAMEVEQIDEIDLTNSSANIIIPPTQFLDHSQENTCLNSPENENQEVVHRNLTPQKNSQENSQKKVSFDLPVIQEVPEDIAVEANVTVNSQMELDTSAVSNESFTKMKEMILKKYKLDLSPDFVYEKKNTDTVVKSKFFKNDNSNEDQLRKSPNSIQCKDEIDKQNKAVKNEVMHVPMAINDEVDMSPKQTGNQKEKSVSGFLFTHGPNGIPDSLDVSISTTGFEDGEGDFAHCIDSSLLLSPKADIPMATSADNVEVFSQDVPNFLSGLRKTGLSFFGSTSGNDSAADSTVHKDNNNFNFNFGGDDKKNRGGLFSMFH